MLPQSIEPDTTDTPSEDESVDDETTEDALPPDPRAAARESDLHRRYLRAVAAAVDEYVDARRPVRMRSRAVDANEVEVCFVVSQAAAFQAILQRHTEGLFPNER
ncbi:MAG: hypothetical protein WD800_01580 [Dehalococcoidia bacterium]